MVNYIVFFLQIGLQFEHFTIYVSFEVFYLPFYFVAGTQPAMSKNFSW